MVVNMLDSGLIRAQQLPGLFIANCCILCEMIKQYSMGAYIEEPLLNLLIPPGYRCCYPQTIPKSSV